MAAAVSLQGVFPAVTTQFREHFSLDIRFVLFAGLDEVAVESIAKGAAGWVSGLSNAFPREGETLP